MKVNLGGKVFSPYFYNAQGHKFNIAECLRTDRGYIVRCYCNDGVTVMPEPLIIPYSDVQFEEIESNRESKVFSSDDEQWILSHPDSSGKGYSCFRLIDGKYEYFRNWELQNLGVI